MKAVLRPPHKRGGRAPSAPAPFVFMFLQIPRISGPVSAFVLHFFNIFTSRSASPGKSRAFDPALFLHFWKTCPDHISDTFCAVFGSRESIEPNRRVTFQYHGVTAASSCDTSNVKAYAHLRHPVNSTTLAVLAPMPSISRRWLTLHGRIHGVA